MIVIVNVNPLLGEVSLVPSSLAFLDPKSNFNVSLIIFVTEHHVPCIVINIRKVPTSLMLVDCTLDQNGVLTLNIKR